MGTGRKQGSICRRRKALKWEGLGEEIVNSQPSAATSTKPGVGGGRVTILAPLGCHKKKGGGGGGVGGEGGGCLEKESTFETFSKSHPLKGSLWRDSL